ncbi:MAG: imidazolonepropionase [Elusimicrobia bacterium]|nr:imidazolonepropionase [Elusimicrobiota bacterium]
MNSSDSAKLFVGISQLVTLAGTEGPRRGSGMSDLSLFQEGAILVDQDRILAAGSFREISALAPARGARKVDLGGRVVLPGFVDSHTHPVFALPRLRDFSLRITGVGYKEIAEKGGGILSTVSTIRETSEPELAEQFQERMNSFLECGTTTLEAKSGYGLDLHSELKILKAIARVASQGPLEVVSTLLGAHAVPVEYRYRRADYIRLVAEEMIPSVVKHGLAEFVDVFCDKGYFTVLESEKILKKALAVRLKVKIHADQLSHSGGAKLAARLKAVSADHLDHVTSKDMAALKKSGTIPVLIPASNFFLGTKYAPARRLISQDLPVALATDFNPGTCPCWNMQMVLSIACTQMKMTVEEAVTATTLNAAYAVGRGDRLGSLVAGKQADFVVMDVEDYREIPYYFGVNHCVMTVKKGQVVYDKLGLASQRS